MLWKYRPQIAAITGNVGKTTTKDMVAEVLSVKYQVRASRKSFNSELGVPLTILGMDTGWGSFRKWFGIVARSFILLLKRQEYPDWLVLEVGADRPGDIEKITKWLHPDLVIVTQMSELPVHVENFSSVEEVVREKSFLIKALKPDGRLILNYDDPFFEQFKKAAPVWPFTVGMNAGADMTGSNYQIVYDEQPMPTGLSLKVEYQGSCVPMVCSGVVGRQLVYPILQAVSVGVKEEMNLVTVSRALYNFTPAPGRMRILKGSHGRILIDDSYNSSPLAVERSLFSLSEIESPGSKTAILGEMRELGEWAAEAHRDIGRRAGDVADRLIAVGKYAQEMKAGFQRTADRKKKVVVLADSQECAEQVEQLTAEREVILIKGSQGERMERVTKALLSQEEKAAEVLVRQEEEWKNR